LFFFVFLVSVVRMILAGVSVASGVAAVEFFLMDASFLRAFGIDAEHASPQTQFLCSCLASLYAAQAALLFCAAVMLDMHGRRAVGWASCGANLLLAENVLRLREMFHSTGNAGIDADRLGLGMAIVVHVSCAIALVAAVGLDLSSGGGGGGSSANQVNIDLPADPSGATPSAPAAKPTGVDWRTFKATTFPGDQDPSNSTAASSSSSANNKKTK
jgi:hypothetical protein